MNCPLCGAVMIELEAGKWACGRIIVLDTGLYRASQED